MMCCCLALTSCALPTQSVDPDSTQTVTLSPAMQKLLEQSDQSINAQNWTQAVAVLERALRINPKQAEAWSRMAVVYLGKNQPEQSINMAKRSNSYANRNTALKSYNWLLMSRAYDQLNQSQLAEQALLKSQQLQQDVH
jgi:cytochrome c-type biogenesis protein CcmH/NrfG